MIPMFLTFAFLDIPNLTIRPDLVKMNVDYQKVVKNIIETQYSVSTWGRQAKTEARNKVRKQIGIKTLDS